jgi:hypothetical protein
MGLNLFGPRTHTVNNCKQGDPKEGCPQGGTNAVGTWGECFAPDSASLEEEKKRNAKIQKNITNAQKQSSSIVDSVKKQKEA